MPTYTDYKQTISKIHASIADDVYTLAATQFEEEEGIKPKQVLPDRTTTDKCFRFQAHNFSGDLYPHKREIYNIEYKQQSFTPNGIASNPTGFEEIGEDLYEAWEMLIGDPNPLHSPPGVNPGPGLDKSVISEMMSELDRQQQMIVADPTLDDFISLIKDKNYQLAGELLNIDFNDLLSPGSGHELSSLFTNGEIHIVYQDEELALLKPEYNHETKLEIAQQRSGRRFRAVEIEGEIPEVGFVVGKDDTPLGLFAHSVDATRLEYTQEVSRDYIHDVMGFDTSLENETDLIDIPEGERLRLQGDLAVECLEKYVVDEAEEEKRCNLPIDNHLVLLRNATLPSDETRDREPITVQVPESTPLNVNHDEHEPVAAGIMPGRYRFYLLPRGLQPQQERPNWPEN